MTTQDILELAARCVAATGPDRELDLRIEAAINPEYAGMDEEHARFLTKYGGHPRYTASLDAAMTLVPEGWRICNLYELIEAEMAEGVSNGPWVCQLSERHEKQGRMIVGSPLGSTASLALTAAALKARAHTKGEE